MASLFNIHWNEISEFNLPPYIVSIEEDDKGVLDIYTIKIDGTYRYWHCLNTDNVLAQPGIDTEHVVILATIHILPARYKEGLLVDRDIVIAYKNETIGDIEINVFTDEIVKEMSLSIPELLYNPSYTINEAVAIKMQEINETYNDAFNTIVINYPQQEVASFPMQTEQALLYKSDPTAAVPFLRLLHNGRLSRGYEETLDQLCDKILSKAFLFEPVSGYLSGLRQAMEKEVEQLAAKVLSGEMTEYKGYKECLKIYVEYPIPSLDEFKQMLGMV